VPHDPSSERQLLEKLGVRHGHRVSVIGINDANFISDLQECGADVATRLRRESDLVFYGAYRRKDLDRLPELRRNIKPDGAIWIVREKGKGAVLKETDIIGAALRARLVDNKIASFSDTQAAMRLVIRLSDRST